MNQKPFWKDERNIMAIRVISAATAMAILGELFSIKHTAHCCSAVADGQYMYVGASV